MGNRRVKKIEIKGFRSFADSVTIDLNGGTVCIADPEGSGVPDLREALCFAAGRSYTQEGSAEEVLFPGNENRNPSPAAEVTLFLEKDPDGVEMSVSRTLRRSGEDEYRIDEQKSTADQVRGVLLGAGIYGYSVFDRNTVYDFITSRKGTIPSVIEQVSGADFLRQDAESAEKELRMKRRELQEVQMQLEECRKQKNFLLDQTVKVKDFRKLSGMKRICDLNIALRRIEQFERDSQTVSIRISELEDRIAAKEKECSEEDLRITENRIRQRNLENEETEARGIFLNCRNDIGDRKSRMSVIDGRIGTVEKNIDFLNQDMVGLRERLEKSRKDLHFLEQQGLKTEELLLTVSENRQKTEEEVRGKYEEMSASAAEYEQTLQNLNERRRDLSVIEAQLSGLEQLLQNSEEYRVILSNILENSQSTLPDSFSGEANMRKRSALEEARGKAEILVRDLEKDLNILEEKTKTLREKQENAFYRFFSENSRLELLTDLEKEYAEDDIEIIRLLKEAPVSGVHNTIGELIQIRRGFESVIAAALGSHTEDIVCEDLSSASAAASYLRQKNAGRRSFIPLKELNYKYRVIPSELLSAEGFLGRALDYTACDSVYAGVFQYLLGSTVVFRDFASASAAGKYAGIRIVTLENEVITDSEIIEDGSLRNSGARVLDQRIRIHSTGARVSELEKACRLASTEYENALAEKTAAEKRLRGIRSEIDYINTEILSRSQWNDTEETVSARIRMDVQRVRKELENFESNQETADISGRMEELNVRFRQTETEVRQLEIQLEKLYRRKDRLKGEISSLEQQMKEYDLSLMSLETEKAVNEITSRKIREMGEAFAFDMGEKQNAMDQIRAEQTALAREKEKLEHEVRTLETEMSDRVRILSTFLDDRNSLRSQIDRMIIDKEKADSEFIAFRLEKKALEVERESYLHRAEEMKKNIFETYQIPYTEALELKETVFSVEEGLKESARLRNLLKDYEEINTAAPEELERTAGKLQSLEEKRRSLLEETDMLQKKIGQLKSSEAALLRKWYDDVGREFSGIFQTLSESSRAYLKLSGSAGEENLSADIYVQRSGYTSGKLLYALPEDQSAAFAAFAGALHTVRASALTLMDNMDSLLQDSDFQFLKNRLRVSADESVIFVTDREEVAEEANAVYVYTEQNKGSRPLRPITAAEFRAYTPDRGI